MSIARSLPLVIVNPAARQGAGARDWPAATSALRTGFGPFACRFTEAPGDACRIAREEALGGRRLILTFGGDGTISETARGIVDSETPAELGVLPHGTGGDFVRSLRLPSRLADAARCLRGGRSVPIDVGSAVLSDGSQRSFVNAASFGLSAEVAHRMNRAHGPGLSGRASYSARMLEAAVGFRHPVIGFRADDSTPRSLTITTVALHNGRFFGGGMHMAPMASLTDGRLNVLLVSKISFWELLRHAPLLYWGAHLGLPEVAHLEVKRFEAWPIDREAAIRVELDGDCVGRLPACFEVKPKALRLRLPA